MSRRDFEFDYANLILRGQGLHNGQLAQALHGGSLAKELNIIIGSHKRTPTIENPFTGEFRRDVIEACLPEELRARTNFVFVKDRFYTPDDWTTDVQEKVRQITGYEFKKICLLGTQKDATSSYLRSFPQWARRGLGQLVGNQSSTAVREALFAGTDRISRGGEPAPRKAKDSLSEILDTWVPEKSAEALLAWTKTPEFAARQEEWLFWEDYLAPYRRLPHAPVFTTTDACVFQSSHVLVIERATNPGKGLLALPGSYLRQDETVYEGIFRSLHDETRIKVPARTLVGSNVGGVECFDHPRRSVKRRVVTHVGCFVLENVGELPQVRAGAGAARAFWLPFNELYDHESRFFDDHFFIILAMMQHTRRREQASVSLGRAAVLGKEG